MEHDHKVQGEADSDIASTNNPASLSSSLLHVKHQQILSQHLPIGIVETSLEGKYIDVSEEFCRLLGYKKEELLQRGIKDITPEADYQLDIQLHNQLVAGEIPSYKIEKRFKRKDGQIIWVDVTRSAIRDGSGNALYIVGIVLDITEIKQVLAALQESEERFRAILRQAAAGIVRKDPVGLLLFVNDEFCRMVGYSSEELTTTGMSCWDLTHPDDLEENQRSFNRMIQDGVPFRMERRLIRKDGSILWCNLSVAPVLDAAGHAISAVGVEVDIMARKKAEESLRQLNLDLESRVEERTAELRNMNQALQKNRRRLQVLSQRLVHVQEEERHSLARELHDRVGQSLIALNLNLTIIQGELPRGYTEPLATRLAESIELVTEVIRLVRDVMSNLRPTNLDDYGLESALQAYLQEFEIRYGIPVQFERQTPPLPRLDNNVEITLLRISQEALTNVARHAQASQASLTLRLDEKQVYLTIEDNGTGIASLEGAKRSRSHGLKIMQERAEALEGTLEIRSVPGKGTKIEAVIPLTQRYTATDSQEPST